MSSSSSVSSNRPSSTTSSPFKKGVSISSASDPNSKRVSFPAAPAAPTRSTNDQKNYRTPHPSAFAAALSQPVPSSSSSSSPSTSSQSSSSSKIFLSSITNEKNPLSFEIEMKEREGEGQIKNVLLQWKKAMKIGALINTGVIAFNSNGEILLIKQAGGTGGVWNFPMGPILAEDKESANIFNSALIEFSKEVGSEWKPSIGKKMEIMGSAFINRSTIVWILYMGEEGTKMFSSSADKKWIKINTPTGGSPQIDIDKGGVLHDEFKKAIDDYQLMQVITEAKNIVINLNAAPAANAEKKDTKEEKINEFQSKCIAMIKRVK